MDECRAHKHLYVYGHTPITDDWCLSGTDEYQRIVHHCRKEGSYSPSYIMLSNLECSMCCRRAPKPVIDLVLLVGRKKLRLRGNRRTRRRLRL